MAGAFSCTKIHIVGNITKVLFIIFNVILLAIGLGILIGGAYLAAISADLSFFTESATVTGAIIIILAGMFSMLFAVIGIIAAIFQLRFILLLYAFMIVVIVILEIAAGIYGFIRFGKLVGRDVLKGWCEVGEDDGELLKAFEAAVAKYSLPNTPEYDIFVERATDLVQNNFDCCGVFGPSSWIDTAYFKSTGGQLPQSCCINDAISCNYNEDDVHSNGCFNATVDFIANNVCAIGGIGILFGIVEIIGIVLAVVLCIFIHVRIKMD